MSSNDSRFGHPCDSAKVRHVIRIGGSLDAETYAVDTTGQIPILTHSDVISKAVSPCSI